MSDIMVGMFCTKNIMRNMTQHITSKLNIVLSITNI